MTGFVFIVAQPRSGSTLVQHFCNLLPGVLVRGENESFLSRSWVQRSSLSDLIALHRGEITDKTHPFYGAENLSLPRYDNAVRAFLTEAVLQPAGNERFIGFKEVRYSSIGRWEDAGNFAAFCEWLLTWPQARIIFCVRDAEACASSGFHRDYERGPLLTDLREQERRFVSLANRHTTTTALVRYETFCKSSLPAQVIGELLGVRNVEYAYAQAMGLPLTHGKDHISESAV